MPRDGEFVLIKMVDRLASTVGWVVRKSASMAPLEERSIISVDRKPGM